MSFHELGHVERIHRPVVRDAARSGARFAVLMLAALGACGGGSDPVTPGGGGSVTPAWTTGQAAEAVLGAPSVSNTGTGGITQSTFVGPGALSVTPSGTLYVEDKGAYRVLRFDNANSKATAASADGVLGQLNFTSGVYNAGFAGSTARPEGIGSSEGLAVDASGNLYVTDAGNTRVMRWNAAATKANGASADGVLGQADLISNVGFGTTSQRYFAVRSVATDATGHLWVVDQSNHRVLRYDNAAAKANFAAADGVLGQASFTTNTTGTTASTMNNPASVAVDGAGNLYVGENSNHRVLIFLNAAAKANGAAADKVLGQPDLVTGTITASVGTQANIYGPYAMTVDGKGTLYVADGVFNRVMVFYNAASKANGANADVVLGKSSFTDISTTSALSTNVGQPYGVTVQSSTGKLWITDYSNRRVLRFQAAAALQ
ncbi:MAG: NHL repeat-containing protein [Gemmatimonadetes bacterium]|nr:NHL repeat-containing protein [Gemmatimonadota bacterium]